jgi:cellulose synthase operon protein C
LEKASAVASRAELISMFDTARAANPGARGQLDELQVRLTGGAAPVVAAPQVAAAPRPAAPVQAAPAPVAAAPVVAGSLPLRGDARLTEVRRLKEQEQYARCLAASTSPRSLDVLYERSWCAYSHQRPTEALVGFQQAARVGDALGPNVRRDAHFGMALSYLSLNMTEQGAQVASQVNLTDTQRREMETIVLDQRGVKAYRQQDYRQAISYFNAMEQVNGSLRRDLAILRAYAYLNVGQSSEALTQFERLHSQLATAETRNGLNAARGQ